MGALALRAWSRVEPPRQAGQSPVLVVEVEVANRGAKVTSVGWGACSVRPLVYRGLRHRGPVVWDGTRYVAPPLRMSNGRTAREGCAGAYSMAELAPGKVLRSPAFPTAWRAVTAILGDSLPGGRYAVAASVDLNRRRYVVPAGVVLLTGGRAR